MYASRSKARGRPPWLPRRLRLAAWSAGCGAAGHFRSRLWTDQLCLDLPGFGSVPPATQVSEYWCDNSFSDNQQFWRSKRPNGLTWWVNYKSGLCLDVDGSGVPNNARITLWWCSDNDDHFWIAQFLQ
ncbi:RICIN domain-containing protein [Streptomyces sp. NPDC002402]